jgi:sugar phosphate isomerase/epimerase
LLQAGTELKAEIAVVHVNSDTNGLDDRLFEESREISIEFIEALNQQAMRLGIQLAIENLPVMSNQMRRFGWSIKELKDAFPNHTIGFCLDIGHVIINGLDLRSEIRAAGERLLSVHASSTDGVADRHWPLDEGVVRWPEVKKELVRNGYKNRYVLEILRNMMGDDPETILLQVAEFARNEVV